MGDPFTELEGALGQANQAALQDNPYVPFGQIGDATQQQIQGQLAAQNAPGYMRNPNNPVWSPTQSVVASVLAGLGGGVAKGLGQNFQNEQGQLAQKALLDSISSGNAPVRPEGMSSSVFAPISNAGSVFGAAKNLQQQDELRKLAEEMALKAAPDAKTTNTDYNNANPEVQQAWEESGHNPSVMKELLGKRYVNQTVIGGLSNNLAVYKELEDLKRAPHTFNGGGFFSGIGNDIASKVSAGSDSASYNSNVIGVADSLLRALNQVGRGSQYTQQQIKDDLSEAFGKGPDALAKRIQHYQDELLTGGQQRASDLVGSGILQAKPILDQYTALAQGAKGASGVDPRMAAFAAQAKAAGMTKEQAAAQWASMAGG